MTTGSALAPVGERIGGLERLLQRAGAIAGSDNLPPDPYEWHFHQWLRDTFPPVAAWEFPGGPIWQCVAWNAFRPRKPDRIDREALKHLGYALAAAPTDEAASEVFLAWADSVRYGGLRWYRGEPCHDGGRERLLRAYWQEAHTRHPEPGMRRHAHPDGLRWDDAPPYDRAAALALLTADFASERADGTLLSHIDREDTP